MTFFAFISKHHFSHAFVMELSKCKTPILPFMFLCILRRFNLIQLFSQDSQSLHLRKMIVDLEVSTSLFLHSCFIFHLCMLPWPLLSVHLLQAPRFESGGIYSQDPALSYVRLEKHLNDDQRRSIHKVKLFHHFDKSLGTSLLINLIGIRL